MSGVHPELVAFGGGVSLRILQTPEGDWRIGEGLQAADAERGIEETDLVPPNDLRERRFDSRADAINAAWAWLSERTGTTG